MILTDHATCDDVRSTLGVSVRELADVVILLAHWMYAVEQQLLDIDDGGGAVMTQFTIIAAILPGSRTAAQTQFYKTVNMYVLYAVSLQLLARADVFSPVDITDGRAAVKRLEERFDKLRPAIEGGLQKFKDRLIDALLVLVPGAAVPAAPVRSTFIGVGIGVDPVTGV